MRLEAFVQKGDAMDMQLSHFEDCMQNVACWGKLIKILWHDGLGMSLYAKRLDRGKFIWPSASDGAVSISAAQMAYMLEGIDWRNPQLSWRPQSAG